MDWKTLLLGLIKGTLAILADDYVYRARQARERARKHAPPQPKVDDWAEPTRLAAATAIVLETDEGRHFAASSFITVEGYAAPRVERDRQPGESRRTRRKRPQEQGEGQLSPMTEASEQSSKGQLAVEPLVPQEVVLDAPVGEMSHSGGTEAVLETPSAAPVERPVQARTHCKPGRSCHRFALYKQRRRLVRCYASRHPIRGASGRRVSGRQAGGHESQIGGSHGKG